VVPHDIQSEPIVYIFCSLILVEIPDTFNKNMFIKMVIITCTYMDERMDEYSDVNKH